MGMRSHIFCRVKTDKEIINIANYYQWNYGERMVSRAAHGLEFLEAREVFFNQVQLENIWDVNFDMGDYQAHLDLIREYREYGEESLNFRRIGFEGDGGLCILVNGNEISYAFASFEGARPLDAESYMEIDIGQSDQSVDEYIKAHKCKTAYERNKRVLKHFHLMTQEEFDAFLDEEI